MTRRHVAFQCGESALAGTLDEASGDSGLLIVSGGNEIRSGAWGGQALLAARLAAHGFPVFRYDRRGAGESEGVNAGFLGGGPDLAAAVAAFRREAPHLRRMIAFGNCDGASTLALEGTALPFDALVLANPWIIDGDNAPADLPPAAIGARYAEKLRNPREWLRLLSGQVNLIKLASGLRRLVSSAPHLPSLAGEMQARLARYSGAVTILLASGDRTAQLFEAAWPVDDPRIMRIPSRSHSFSGAAAREWLFQRLLEALRG